MSKLPFQRRRQRQQKTRRRRCLDDLAHALWSEVDAEVHQDPDAFPRNTQLREKRKNRLDVVLVRGPVAGGEDRRGPNHVAAQLDRGLALPETTDHLVAGLQRVLRPVQLAERGAFVHEGGRNPPKKVQGLILPETQGELRQQGQKVLAS